MKLATSKVEQQEIVAYYLNHLPFTYLLVISSYIFAVVASADTSIFLVHLVLPHLLLLDTACLLVESKSTDHGSYSLPA